MLTELTDEHRAMLFADSEVERERERERQSIEQTKPLTFASANHLFIGTQKTHAAPNKRTKILIYSLCSMWTGSAVCLTQFRQHHRNRSTMTKIENEWVLAGAKPTSPPTSLPFDFDTLGCHAPTVIRRRPPHTVTIFFFSSSSH